VEWSGVEWSGVEWSRVEWNYDTEWRGVEWSGVEWNYDIPSVPVFGMEDHQVQGNHLQKTAGDIVKRV
jgi:hypothetical protein